MDLPKPPEPSEKIGRYRWVIVGLLFAAMVINYVDRQTIGLLKTDLSKEFGWSEGDYADLVFYFQLSYAVAYLAWGKIMDKIGARWGFGIAFAIWQVAHIAHAGAKGLNGFIFARMGLGVGEAGGFPGGIKAVAEWFPKRERAFATGIFNAGTNIGAIVTPLVVPAIVLAWGWQELSLYTGYVTGPRKQSCPAGCSGWRHFGHALGVNLWHEIAIVAVALAIWGLCGEAVNNWGLWAYMLLWAMHLSARLNVFLGVRNVSEEFVPAHMAVLKSFLTRKSMNLLFPFSITAATIGAVLLFQQAFSADLAAERAGWSLLAALAALAAPGARLMPVRVLDDDGTGTMWNVTEGMYWAAAHGARVINMSLGGPGSCSPSTQSAINFAVSAGAAAVVSGAGGEQATVECRGQVGIRRGGHGGFGPGTHRRSGE